MGLTFGLHNTAPETAEAQWGGRWIFPDDILWDRTSWIGYGTPAGDRLKSWLNTGALGKAREAARKSGLSQSENRTVVLYEDAAGVIKGNPNGSYGYLYVVAWLK
jgi:hypothetical protein